MDAQRASGGLVEVPRPHPVTEVSTASHELTCLHELFERQADRFPDRPAVTRGSLTFSYRELEERANQLARHLRGQGVGAGDLVALYLERSATTIVALLACLKAGAGYVPIDPIYPSERIRFILEHSGVAAVLTEEALLGEGLPAYSGTVVLLDRDWSLVACQPTGRLSRAETGASGSSLAYVIYTSGTTGRPKGVMTEHRSVVHFVSAFNDVCAVTEADRIYQGFSLSFDGSVEEIWMALAHGASLIVPPGDVARIGSEVGRLLNESRATVFSTVPTMLS
ncbi:MAG TPA: AMP-binding protein, partial [Propionibacteriaceae bacterium]|nr:AMP-binding protein [Propionibacteriaceae bacterium]